MGMNYYLYKKDAYPAKDENSFYHNDSVQVLENGYVFDNKYYQTLEELNKNYYRKYHIGKDSYGWHFLLSQYCKENILTLNDWKQLFYNENNLIYNEEKKLISPDDMLNIIFNKPKCNDENILVNQAIGKKNLYKHTDQRIVDNNTDGTYDITNDPDFS